MSRYISFGVLIAVILFLGIIFFRVMASFVLPLFLGTVLVVVFAPIHKWVREKTGDRKTLAAAITTAIISLAVILPAGGVGLFAFGEARQLFKNLTAGGFEQNLKRIRKSLQLEMPAPDELRSLEKSVRALDVRNIDELDVGKKQLNRIVDSADRLELELKIPVKGRGDEGPADLPLIAEVDVENWNSFRNALRNALELRTLLDKLQKVEQQLQLEPAAGDGPPEKDAKQGDAETEAVESDLQKTIDDRHAAEIDYKAALEQVVASFNDFRIQALGGSLYAYFKEMANPSPEEFEKYNAATIKWIRENFLSLGGQASQFVFGAVFNVVIMMIGVFFFLVDGPKMLAAVKFFSPLDDRHEEELINEFGIVSRAVMVATLSAAVVQGALAGIGYYFAGVEAVFLLTLMTGVLAMVPFVGATAVWLPTSLYLYVVEDRLVAAVLLAIWGAGVVSTIDNFIKPLILHGQSNIHPLLALLSVLGGVATLGPIGILVGPMVVAFLQTLLAILQREIIELDQRSSPDNGAEDESPPETPVPPESTDKSSDADALPLAPDVEEEPDDDPSDVK